MTLEMCLTAKTVSVKRVLCVFTGENVGMYIYIHTKGGLIARIETLGALITPKPSVFYCITLDISASGELQFPDATSCHEAMRLLKPCWADFYYGCPQGEISVVLSHVLSFPYRP